MADPAQIRIVNNALYATGQEPVADLSDASLEASVAAVKVLRVLEQARDTLLNRHGWVCALEYATLAPAIGDGFTNWRYPSAFQLPGAAQRVWEIDGEAPVRPDYPGSWGPRWQVGTVESGDSARWLIRAAAALGGGTLDSLNVSYVRKASWAALSAHLADAISFEAAARSAYAITGERSLANELAKKAETQIATAIGVDGTQEGGQPPASPSIPAALRNLSR